MNPPTEFFKYCRTCNKKMVYKRVYELQRSIKKNSRCKRCVANDQCPSIETRHNMSVSAKLRMAMLGSPSKRPEVKEKLRHAIVARLKSGTWKQTSKSSLVFLNKLEQIYGIKIEREFKLGGRFFDGKYKNILIEIDGQYWHSQPKIKKVDIEKNKIAEDSGYVLFRFILNSTKEIPQKLIEYTHILDDILL